MLLVPRQLRRSGMTGAVPYYGGRLTPAQAYAASHPQGHPPAGSVTAWNPLAAAADARAAPPAAAPARGAPPVAAPVSPPPAGSAPPRIDSPAALEHLRDSGVLTEDEYEQLLARTRR